MLLKQPAKMARKLVIAVTTAAFCVVTILLWPRQAAIIQVPTNTGPKIDVDVEAAKARLSQYEKVYGDQSEMLSPVDPLNASTVTTWWQAAALMHSYSESKPRYKCKVKTRFGNWAACMDPPYTIKPPCLVYSFGIGFDFSFDDAMAKHGCMVHSFDPSMKKKSHKRSKRVMFHNLGLSGHNTDGHVALRDPLYVKENQTWAIRTLSSIKRMLGHTGMVLDVLKIDIESFEWEVLENLMETEELQNVRQLSLEFHFFNKRPPREDYIRLYNMYTRLRGEFGFLEYSVAPHPYTLKLHKYNVQSDVQFVNSGFRYNSAS